MRPVAPDGPGHQQLDIRLNVRRAAAWCAACDGTCDQRGAAQDQADSAAASRPSVPTRYRPSPSTSSAGRMLSRRAFTVAGSVMVASIDSASLVNAHYRQTRPDSGRSAGHRSRFDRDWWACFLSTLSVAPGAPS